jgi:hypothetical protein
MVERGEHRAEQQHCERRHNDEPAEQDVASEPEGSKHSSACRVSPMRFVWSDNFHALNIGLLTRGGSPDIGKD